MQIGEYWFPSLTVSYEYSFHLCNEGFNEAKMIKLSMNACTKLVDATIARTSWFRSLKSFFTSRGHSGPSNLLVLIRFWSRQMDISDHSFMCVLQQQSVLSQSTTTYIDVELYTIWADLLFEQEYFLNGKATATRADEGCLSIHIETIERYETSSRIQIKYLNLKFLGEGDNIHRTFVSNLISESIVDI